ncbi:cache domain-containing sensor histidine kinase [Clostridium sp. C105KSO13]|uniref:cache domain-containing sensor histidine kinase n=1 Tax=Clostridium sp. C105KSO13 TaxID=1776045 RepID=UPI00074088A5|nr:histidine kinase [Clostridium sp. C105KSO13]CUX35820.1 Sensor histidine kinase YpdA [Clostridium sp. C105KSO13]
MKLRSKILIMCLSCTLVALILQTLLFQETSSNIIYRRAKTESVNSLQNMQNEIYRYLKNMESNLLAMYSEDDFIQALKARENIEQMRIEFYRKAYEIGTTGFETGDNVVALYLYNPKHEIISTYRRAMTPRHNYPADIYEDTEYSNAETIRKYVKSGQTKMLLSSYYNEYRETDIIRLSIKLYNNRNYSKAIGYIVCDVDSKAISSIMEKYSTDKSMYIWLQPVSDRPAVSIGTLSRDEKQDYQEISEYIKSGAQARGGPFGTSKQELFQVEQNKYNLGAYSLMPQELLKQNQRALTVNLLLIGSIMAAVTAVLTSILSQEMTRPLKKLMNTIEKIKEGNTSLRASVGSEDEIGMLGKNFNEMLGRLEELTAKEKQANYLLSQAEYKALQAQINPHFLYNTLDTMSSIAQIKECPEVSRLSQSLSNIFRYSLNMKDPFSTVSKEIVHLKNYCYVMDTRMQDNIQYVYEIDETVLQEEIPRLSLQPLVENALNHGLRSKRGDKFIQIQVKSEAENLTICVADNGIGMDADKFNKNLKKNDLKYVEKGDSIGLHNINARLKMLYGNEYGLWIESVIGEGTKIYMRIPRKKAEEENGEKEV